MTSIPQPRTLRVAVIGAGMSGILAGIKLLEAQLTNFTIYEKGPRPGGTWRDNSYPGLACDVPSHHYTYSFEPNPDWSQLFSPGPEILRYFERVADKYGVTKHIRVNQEVTRARYHQGKWLIETASGICDEVDLVICATGFLHHPGYPKIEGLDTFAGACFHSARWDHSVTIKEKRVGIIGTGSTAMQILPAIVDDVAKVSLFQRTAQWVLPLPNATYTEAERAAFKAAPETMLALYNAWSERFQNTISRAVIGDSKEMARLENGCRANLENNVLDPVLRARLTPNYKVACKRLVMSDIFYPAIQRPNAELVTAGIAHLEPAGIRDQAGRLHELEVLVLATGFNGHAFMRPMEVLGEGGHSLAAEWADSNQAHRSTAIPGFPNFLMLVGPSSPIGNFSVILIAELQMAYILRLLAPLLRGENTTIAPRRDSTEAFNKALRAAMGGTVWASGCKSWYLDKNGNAELWPWTFERFRDEMAVPRFEEYELGV